MVVNFQLLFFFFKVSQDDDDEEEKQSKEGQRNESLTKLFTLSQRSRAARDGSKDRLCFLFGCAEKKIYKMWVLLKLF